MLTWRYHLLSLVAVFLALGLGVLVGVSLSGNGTVETGQAVLVNDIQNNLEVLQKQNDILSRERANDLRFEDDAFPYIVGGRLQGKKIALVASDKAGDELLRQVDSSIHAAGGQVISTSILNPRFDAKAAADKIKNEFRADPSFATVDASSVAKISAAPLAREISGRAGSPRFIPVIQGLLMDSANGSYELPVDAVIMIAKADDDQSPLYSDLEKQFLLNLKNLSVLPVGAETTDAQRSEIPLFISIDVSSVDNLESRIGQLSLIFTLGGERGAFGVKTTADMLIPILRTPKQPLTAPAA